MTSTINKKNTKPRKKELRRYLHKVRDNLSSDQVIELSESIHQNISRLDAFREARTVHIYLSIARQNEVDTIPITRELLENDRKVVVPVTLFEDHSLRHVLLERLDNLVVNKWHVPEPPEPHNDSISLADLDLVLVPMLGGDLHGNRLGYGKGYYDRFLKQVRCPKVGLLFECCLVDEVPTENHDVTLDYIVTDRRVISIKK